MHGQFGRRRLVVAIIAATTGLLITPARATPPSRTADFTAPYDLAGFLSNTGCTTGATCTVTGSADATNGNASTSSDFSRTAAAAGTEEALGNGYERVTFKVPRGASSVTATFLWHVNSATASATSTSGRLFADVGVYAAVTNCDANCSTSPSSNIVLISESDDGSPAVPSGSSDPQDITLTVTSTGTLPHILNLSATAFSQAGGQAVLFCPPTGGTCEVVSPQHAGTAHAAIFATLRSIHVSTS
jgi:hypothetical protein